MRFLTKKELHRLTGRKQRTSQVTALQMMQIEHRVNPCGDVIVIDVDLPLNARKETPKVELDLDAA